MHIEELERMINSKDVLMRVKVAKQGYGLDKLIFDIAKNVIMVAIDTLKELVEQGKAKLTVEILG